MTRLTREQVEAARGRAEKAQPLPWIEKNLYIYCGDGPLRLTARPWNQGQDGSQPEPPENHLNREFIAQARSDIPALCADWLAMREALAELVKAVGGWGAVQAAASGHMGEEMQATAQETRAAAFERYQAALLAAEALLSEVPVDA